MSSADRAGALRSCALGSVPRSGIGVRRLLASELPVSEAATSCFRPFGVVWGMVWLDQRGSQGVEFSLVRWQLVALPVSEPEDNMVRPAGYIGRRVFR